MSKSPVILERLHVSKGSIVVKEGEPGKSAYLIQSGSVEVFTYNKNNNHTSRITLATFDAGQIFGELSLIFDEPRSASVLAKEDCNLIVITRHMLKQKLEESDPTVQAIVEMLTKRILTVNNALVAKQSNIQDLLDTSRIIYQNILTSLPRSEQRGFQNAVLPKLDDFLKAVRGFQGDIKDNIKDN